jgi:hypothetical protein
MGTAWHMVGQAHGGATLSPQLSAAASVREYAGTLPQTGHR